MIERAHQTLSIRSQWRLPALSRSPLYYEPRGETGMNLGLMRLIRRPLLGHFKCPVRQRAGECEAIAERGQAVPGNADDVAPATRGPCCEPKAHPAPDAPYAIDADHPKTRHPLPGNTYLHV
jgi:hypothetical protein